MLNIMDEEQYARYVAHEESKAYLQDYRQAVENEEYRKRLPSAMNQGFNSDYTPSFQQDQNR